MLSIISTLMQSYLSSWLYMTGIYEWISEYMTFNANILVYWYIKYIIAIVSWHTLWFCRFRHMSCFKFWRMMEPHQPHGVLFHQWARLVHGQTSLQFIRSWLQCTTEMMKEQMRYNRLVQTKGSWISPILNLMLRDLCDCGLVQLSFQEWTQQMRDMLEARKRGDFAFRDKDFKTAIDCYSQV